VRSQLRRYAQLGSRTELADELRVGSISLNHGEKTVTVDGSPVALTPIEYSILYLLMRNPGKVYSTKALYEAVWQETAIGSEGAVAVHIRHLREKLEIDPSNPRYLKVVWGQGYKIEEGR
jgi:DNA-binding response OmpR family regulator